MRALKTLLPLWLFGALLWPFLAVGAEDVIPLRIVGNGDASPSGGVFQDVYEGDIDSGRVVFRGGFDDAGNWGSGVYAYQNGVVSVIADTNMLIPGSVVHFQYFPGHAQDNGVTAFLGDYPEYCLFDSCKGLFRHDSGGISLVADTNTTVPGKAVDFGWLGYPTVSGGTIAFDGAYQQAETTVYGIYANLGAGLITVADASTPVPGGIGNLSVDFTQPYADGDSIYFMAFDNATWQPGIYAWRSGTGDVEVVVDQSTPLPGAPTGYSWLGYVVRRDGTLAFYAELSEWPNRAVYADFGEGFQVIVDNGDLVEAGLGAYASMKSLAAGGDMVAFVAEDSLVYLDWLFAYRNGELRLVLPPGAVLDGKVVESIDLDPMGVEGNTIAFLVHFVGTWEPVMYTATFHTPNERLASSPDLDGMGYDEIVILRYDEDGYRYIAQVTDSYTGGMLNLIDLGPDPAYDMAVLENPGQTPKLAVLGRKTTGRVRVQIMDMATGQSAGNLLFFGLNMTPVDMALLPDMNGNGSQEIAVVAISPANYVRVQIRDSVSGALLNDIANGAALIPESLHAAVDLNTNGSPEFVIFGVARKTGQYRAMVQDSSTKEVLKNLYYGYVDQMPVYSVMVVADPGGVPDLVVGSQSALEDKAVILTRDLMTGDVVSRRTMTSTAALPMKLVATEDLTGDGVDDLAALMVEPGIDNWVELVNHASGAGLGQVDQQALIDAEALLLTGDLNANGAQEMIVLGKHFGFNLLEIHDCDSGIPLRYYFVP